VLRWCTDVAGVRHVPTADGAQALPAVTVREWGLLPLPAQDFELASESRRTSARDHLRVAHALYSVPWRLIGSRVDASDNGRTIVVFCDGTVVKAWARVGRGKQTDWNDRKPEKAASSGAHPRGAAIGRRTRSPRS
jgi:hypothetical protein